MLCADEQFAANLQTLTARAAKIPALASLPDMLRHFPLVGVQFAPLPDGQLYGNVWCPTNKHWVPLCHPTDPLGNARADAERLYTRNARVFCLFGLGLGYFATEFAKLLQPHQKMVIWELDPNIFKAMLYAVDIAPLFCDKKIDVIVGAESVNQVESWWLQLEAQDKLHLQMPLEMGYVRSYMEQEYTALRTKTEDMIRFHAVGLATWRAFGGHIGDNDILNMPEYFATPGYEHLAGLWSGPAVCVAAGPSLQKNLRLLLQPEIRQQVAVIAAGTVYALMESFHLSPDIVTTIDFQRLNWTDQFRHIPLENTCPLVYLHSTYPQTVRRWPGPKFVAENASDTVGWLRQFSGGKQSAAQVQTVAHLNLMVALTLGANPIILVGQDLAMPPDQHHAVGARAQDVAPNDAVAEAFVMMPDCYGNPVHTRHSFLSMKTVFERIIAEHPDRTFVNCTEGGLVLAGAQHMPLQAALDLCATTPKEAPGLRERIAEVAQKYVPQVSTTLLPEYRRLRADVEDMARFSQTVTAFVREHGLGTASVRAWVLQQEKILQDKKHAFGLFAIRHFGIIELLAEIPPDEATLTEEDKQLTNCRRLVRVAQMITEVLPQIRYLLRTTYRRLLDVVEPLDQHVSLQTLGRLCSRQSYAVVQRYLEQPFEDHDTDWLRMHALLLWHRQQYTALQAYAHLLPRGRRARLREYLAQYRAFAGATVPAFFQLPHIPVSPSVARGMSGEAVGA